MAGKPQPPAAMMRSPEQIMAYGQQILASQSFSRLLGTELHALTAGQAELHLPVTGQMQQQNGFVHGGVLSYLADNALTYAGGTALAVPVLTSEYKVNYLRPARGERLIARARALHHGRTQAVCLCEVFSVEEGVEKLCVVATGTIVALPAPKKPA